MMDRHDASTKTEERGGTREKTTNKLDKGDDKDKVKTVTHDQKPEGSRLFKFIHNENSLAEIKQSPEVQAV